MLLNQFWPTGRNYFFVNFLMSSVSVGHPYYTKTLRGVDKFLLDNCILIKWSVETDQTVVNTFTKIFLVFHSDYSVSFQDLSSDSFSHIFVVRKINIALRGNCEFLLLVL